MQKMEVPEWALRVGALLARLDISARKLANRCGVSPMAVSRWMSGENEPDGKGYVALGKIAPPDIRWWFFEKAGISATDMLAALPDSKQRTQGVGPCKIEVRSTEGAVGRSLKTKGKAEYVAIPLLKDSAAAGEPRIIEDGQIEDTIVVRRAMCPHPDATVCVRVYGDSMTPVLEDGYIVAIDTTMRDRTELYKAMVAAIGPDGGCTIKWLRKSGREEMLVPQHTSLAYDPVVITDRQDWRIVGKVLWWIGFPSPTKK